MVVLAVHLLSLRPSPFFLLLEPGLGESECTWPRVLSERRGKAKERRIDELAAGEEDDEDACVYV